MNDTLTPPEDELYVKLKWLMFSRVLFTTLLIGSTIILHLREALSPISPPLLVLYGLIAGIFILSFIYAVALNWIKHRVLFAYIQIAIDTVVVSLIIFVTGSFTSIFSFLYLLVIIYASMLLFRSGSMIMAALCSIQYGVMIDLEYYGVLAPFGMEQEMIASGYGVSYVFYKIIITMIACFAVAILSSFLSEQARKTKKELRAMEDHIKRVEKMAAVGEMAAGLAHEIKNPLAALSGSIQLIREDNRHSAEHTKLMKIVLREADRLSSLVSSFLLFAKPPVGRIERIELDRAISETVELFEKDKSCRERISVIKDLIPGMWVNMDPVHLHQIFWNLFLNAAEAIEGSGIIRIRMYPMSNKHTGVDISDNGCGMSREVAQSIFAPFFTTKPNGTGLGLSIVHSILESYENRLDVDSEVDRGTTMTLKFKQTDPSG
jgi:signal transduction histidine kinase